MWSDPDDIETWIMSNRGAGWIFGWKVVNEVSLFIIDITKFIRLLCSKKLNFLVQSLK